MMLFRCTILVALTLLLAACGDDSTSDSSTSSDDTDDASTPPVASYELTADGPKCSEGAQITRSTFSDGCTLHRCQWVCAEYDEQYPLNVSFTFRGCSNEEWTLETESIQTADSQTCDVLND